MQLASLEHKLRYVCGWTGLSRDLDYLCLAMLLIAVVCSGMKTRFAKHRTVLWVIELGAASILLVALGARILLPVESFAICYVPF